MAVSRFWAEFDLPVRLVSKYFRMSRVLRGEERGTSEIAQVVLPSGDRVWVRIQVNDRSSADHGFAGPQDVGLGDSTAPPIDARRLPGFAEAVRGVVVSVWQALDEHKPDLFSVEFGIEITARTGRLLSVLAETGGTAHVRVTASWGSGGPASGSVSRAEAAEVE